MTIEPEPEPDYSEAWFSELVSYLALMYQIELRVAQFDPLFDSLCARAARDARLFFDPKWQDGFQQLINGMMIAGKIADDATPSASLGEVHLLFKHAQLLYTMRTLHAVNALACLRQGNVPGAAQELQRFKDATVDLAQMAGERARILNPVDSFASLRDYIRQKKLERARVAAEQT